MSALPQTDRVEALECGLRCPGKVSLILAFLLSAGWWSAPAARAQTAPMVISVTPTNGALDVPTNSTIVFVFDQDMTKVTPIASKPGLWVGNFEITPTNLSVSGSWGADKRTLTLKCAPGWP
ncbi:MAG TPA: Ig-like domain-containing protein, partial [Verrucomicrobiae bacterium]|nr:Ig-like domain-containing protein [Verrucomicrobiae bacterium]